MVVDGAGVLVVWVEKRTWQESKMPTGCSYEAVTETPWSLPPNNCLNTFSSQSGEALEILQREGLH